MGRDVIGRIDDVEQEILVNADYAAPGYGILTSAEREAISLFAKYEGLLLERDERSQRRILMA